MRKRKPLLIVVLVLFAITISCKKSTNRAGGQDSNRDTTAALREKKPFVLKPLGVDKRQVMRYVACSAETVDSMLAMGDTIWSNTENYTLEDLGMEHKEYNKYLNQDFSDTIPAVTALFASYDMITSSGSEEVNATFVWQEVARMQMKRFFEGKGGVWEEPEGRDKFFRVINSITDTYNHGSQMYMNMAAWRSVMPADYRLVEAYKQLIDACQNQKIIGLVHEDYRHVLSTYRQYNESIDESYSDLPRELGEVFKELLHAKQRNINTLIEDYKAGRIGINDVRKNLKEHYCIVGKNERVKLTVNTLGNIKVD